MTDYTEIEQARAKAHAKHGDNSIEGIDAADPRWLSILVEEIGEVSHELTYDATGSLRAELIDVLAVASAWLDALDGRAPGASSAARLLLEIVTRIDEARYVNEARYDEDTSSPWANTDVLELLAHLRQPYTEGGATAKAEHSTETVAEQRTTTVREDEQKCVPSTEHIRAVYAAQHGDILAEEHGREFDRWLTTHDAEVTDLSELGRRYALRAADGYRRMRETAYLEADRLRDAIRAAPHDEECEFGELDPRSYTGTGVTTQPLLPCTCWKVDALDPERST